LSDTSNNYKIAPRTNPKHHEKREVEASITMTARLRPTGQHHHTKSEGELSHRRMARRAFCSQQEKNTFHISSIREVNTIPSPPPTHCQHNSLSFSFSSSCPCSVKYSIAVTPLKRPAN